MKKVLIDVTALSDQYKIRGIGIYIRELVKRLVTHKEFVWCLLGFDEAKELPWVDKHIFYTLGKMRVSNPLNPIFFKLKWMPIIRKVKPDIYFAPHFERGIPLSLCKTVVTMHDVTPFIMKKYSSKGYFINMIKGLFYHYNLQRAKQADLIFTHSEFSKKELTKVGFSGQNIKVCYLGIKAINQVDQKDFAKVMNKYRIHKPYIFYYGGLEPNKNVEKLLDAFAVLVKSEQLTLVLVDKNLYREGGKLKVLSHDAQRIKEKVNELGIEDKIVFPKYIDEKHLYLLLHNAEFFVHLSSYEGFGFVALEAMTNGCPVIAAHRSCYPEILGDAALLKNPDNTIEIVETMKELLHNKKLRENLIQKGFERVQRYSWERTTQQTLRYFKELF
jgi:glycosyltransferase involved in cell wall biosynthesis